MSPLREKFIEDMKVRGLAPATQRSYIHYVAGYAGYFNRSPGQLDCDAIHQYLVHLTEDQKMSAESVNTCISALKHLYLNTLEMPWTDEYFPRVRRPTRLPIVAQSGGSAALVRSCGRGEEPRGSDGLLWSRSAHFRNRGSQSR
jgi:integrase/recombinase XerD